MWLRNEEQIHRQPGQRSARGSISEMPLRLVRVLQRNRRNGRQTHKEETGTERLIYYKESAHAIMKAEKSQHVQLARREAREPIV